MTQPEIRALLGQRDALVLTLYGEGAGEPERSQVAIACSIRNRVQADLHHDGKPDWWGEGYRGVCLARAQYSCWWELTAKNTIRLYALAERVVSGRDLGADALIVGRLGAIADAVMRDQQADITNGATHYVTHHLLAMHPPKWSIGRTPCASIGSHAFFKDIES